MRFSYPLYTENKYKVYCATERQMSHANFLIPNHPTYVVTRCPPTSLSDADLQELYKLEEEGRARASQKDGFENPRLKVNKDRDFFRNVYDQSDKVRRFFRTFGETQMMWVNFIEAVQSLAYDASNKTNSCAVADLKRNECPMKSVEYYLNSTDNAAKGLPEAEKTRAGLKGGCTIHTKLKPMERYVELDLLDDVTSCFHHNINHAKIMAREWHKEGKCMWRE